MPNGHGAGLTLRFALTDPYGIALLSNASVSLEVFALILDPYGPLSIFRTLVLRKSFNVSGSLGCRFNNLSVVVFLILKRR